MNMNDIPYSIAKTFTWLRNDGIFDHTSSEMPEMTSYSVFWRLVPKARPKPNSIADFDPKRRLRPTSDVPGPFSLSLFTVRLSFQRTSKIFPPPPGLRDSYRRRPPVQPLSLSLCLSHVTVKLSRGHRCELTATGLRVRFPT